MAVEVSDTLLKYAAEAETESVAVAVSETDACTNAPASAEMAADENA